MRARRHIKLLGSNGSVMLLPSEQGLAAVTSQAGVFAVRTDVVPQEIYIPGDIGDGKVGEHFNALLKRWSSNMNVDISGQIQKWNKVDGDLLSGPSPYKFKSK